MRAIKIKTRRNSFSTRFKTSNKVLSILLGVKFNKGGYHDEKKFYLAKVFY